MILKCEHVGCKWTGKPNETIAKPILSCPSCGGYCFSIKPFFLCNVCKTLNENPFKIAMQSWEHEGNNVYFQCHNCGSQNLDVV
jgi:hypothetical protein